MKLHDKEVDSFEQEEDDSDDLIDFFEYTADPGQEMVRIDKYLMDRMLKKTRSKIQKQIDAGYVTVNGKTVKSNHKIKPLDKIKVRWKRSEPKGHVVPEEMQLDIRYEDDEVLILHKPAGLVVHPGVGNHSGTLVNGLAWHFQNLPKGNGSYPGLVHRIDKNTTGLLAIAKTEEAIQELAQQFFHHTIERKYRALVWGDVEKDSGTIEGPIGRDPRNRKRFGVYEEGEGGKDAVTHYKVLRRYGYVTLIECQLETGRTHQIRVHMNHIGHPLFNDELYGGDRIVKGTVFTKYKQFVMNCFKLLPHQALHAFSLGFEHPKTGERVYLEAPLPDYFQACLDKWEGYTEGRLKK
jgi:23S rRNA pseudouridine1911/1915/1917 synthase